MLISNIQLAVNVLILLGNLCNAQQANPMEIFMKTKKGPNESTVKNKTVVNGFALNAIPWIEYHHNSFEMLPERFNWLMFGLPIRIKTQISKCNACWAYAVASLAEAMYSLEKSGVRRLARTLSFAESLANYEESLRFSEFELLMCYGKGDCRHRSTQHVLEYGYKHGLLPEQFFPKTICLPSTSFKFRTLYAIRPDEESIQSYILNRGPVILHLYLPIKILKNYIGTEIIGPFPECEGRPPNHAMLAVGFGEENGVKYWFLQNSWGTDWGNLGYVKWRRGINACNIEANPVAASFLSHW